MTDVTRGLTREQAKRRLEENGENRLAAARGKSPIGIFLAQFKDVLIVILAAAAVFSVTVGEFTEAVSIIAIMLLNAVMGFIQEYKTERTLAALALLSAPNCTVRRDKKPETIPASEVVAGDILLLSAGDRVAADARLLSADFLETDESLLTGESHPVHKRKNDRVFMGTSVAAGYAEAEVYATGMSTEMGGIAGMISDIKPEKTPLERRLARLGNQIAVSCLGICALVAGVGLLRGEQPLDMILMGLSLAVAAIPEGLPAVVTVVLALSVNRILKKGALIRRLHAVESLGCAGVICCDKTGTITQNKMTVRELYAGFKSIDGALNRAGREALLCGCLCTAATADRLAGGYTVSGSPTEGALLEKALEYGIEQREMQRSYPAIEKQPFDSIKKYMSVAVRAAGGRVEYIKGAHDRVLDMCTRVMCENGTSALTQIERGRIDAQARDMARRALRVIAFAKKDDAGTTFLGLAGLLDPPRPEVSEAVKSCKRMGIRAVMITGDLPETAMAIAGMVGIDCRRAVTGAEIDKMNDKQLRDAARECSIFARVAPQHKLRLVRAYKSLGLVTVMTGDGVNDAPAVKEADVGVAMGKTGTEVTKEAAGVVIMDDNFATIVAAVREGRIIYQNIRKFINYLLACNLGEVLTVVLGMAVGAPQIFVPVQLLLINLITDGLPAIALGLEPAGRGVDDDPPRKSSEGILTKRLFARIVTRGFALAFCNLVSFMAAYTLSGDLTVARTAAYMTLVFSQMLYVLTSRGAGKLFSNPALSGAAAFSLLVTVATVYFPPLQLVFKTAPVIGAPLLAAAGATLISPLLGWLFDRIMEGRPKQ